MDKILPLRYNFIFEVRNMEYMTTGDAVQK